VKHNYSKVVCVLAIKVMVLPPPYQQSFVDTVETKTCSFKIIVANYSTQLNMKKIVKVCMNEIYIIASFHPACNNIASIILF